MAAKVSYTVLVDTREKCPWAFEPGEHCVGSVRGTLDTGDYSLLGYEHLFRLERKGTVQEFVQNISTREKWANFRGELERLEGFAAPFVILEFTADDLRLYPRTASLPPRVKGKVRVSPHFLVKRFFEIQLAFKTKFIFAGPLFGREWAASLFKRVVERWEGRGPASGN